MNAYDLNILGKDYLTEAEAAHYACVSKPQFRKMRTENGLMPFDWMGKKCYKKSDIAYSMEKQRCQQLKNAARAIS